MFLLFCLAFLMSWFVAYQFQLPKTLPKNTPQLITYGQPQTISEILAKSKNEKLAQDTTLHATHISQEIKHISINHAAAIKAFHIASTLLPIGFIIILLQLEELAILEQTRLSFFILPVLMFILLAMVGWRILLYAFVSQEERETIKKHFMTWGIIGWLSLGSVGSYLANFYLDKAPSYKVSGVITSIVCDYRCSTRKWWQLSRHSQSGGKFRVKFGETSFDCFTKEKRTSALEKQISPLKACTREVIAQPAKVFLKLDGESTETVYSIDDETLIALNGARPIVLEIHPGYLGVPWTLSREIQAAY